MPRSSQAAAVPASKVVIHETYAIKRNDKLIRFNVSAVVTRRVHNHGNPYDYESWVEGVIVAPDNNGKPSSTLTVKPAELLGLYTEHVELVARSKAEADASNAAMQARKDATTRLAAALYEATGIDPLDNPQDYSAPFRVSHNGEEIDISRKGVAPLLRFFERVKQSA
jgi:hypothetical protein